MVSTRANIITSRTYNRPIFGDDGELLRTETWHETIDRVILHQHWLWERAKGANLSGRERSELVELQALFMARKVLPAGRTLWLGGTEIVREREIGNFNCSGLVLESVHDLVDLMWLLLNGCGVGFVLEKGTLNGFANYIQNVTVVRSERAAKGGRERNKETWEPDSKTWTLSIGDSGEAWAKAIGKLLAGKFPAKTLVFDLSQIRPAGGRLSQYGWISSGDNVLAVALPKMAEILNRRAGQLLSKIDMLDIANLCGVIQTGRRGAEIALMRYGDAEWEAFARAKHNYWDKGLEHRTQSNNSLIFYEKPSKKQLASIFDMMIDSGGSEPGFINGEAALRRAPWYRVGNPCNEILLGNKGICNLVETDLARFRGDAAGLARATQLVARANYRQTCVNLDDGILQSAWHENNQFLRLCGAGLTGIVRRPDMVAYDFKVLRNLAIQGAYWMADDLKLPHPKNVTTIKPSGTLGKIMDTTEGLHKPLGKYIFNNVNFSSHDPLVSVMEEAGYRIFANPDQSDAVLVTLPVSYPDVPFEYVDGKHLNLETAIDQLERYRMLQENYVEQNSSVTISYDPSERKAILDWIDKHWDNYVGVSFLLRNDPSKSAKDLGYPYLPQEVVSEEEFNEYNSHLKEVDIGKAVTEETVDVEDCVGGACPVR